MIEITIQQAARKRGITKAFQLQNEIGFSPAVAADLWRGKKLPRLETLEKLCEKWRCPLTELVCWVPEKHTKTPARRNGAKKLR